MLDYGDEDKMKAEVQALLYIPIGTDVCNRPGSGIGWVLCSLRKDRIIFAAML
jgi:hypothetical protein